MSPVNVFVSDVDMPVGHEISRRLARTVIGSRRQAAQEGDNEETEPDVRDDNGDPVPKAPRAMGGKLRAQDAAETYTIAGSVRGIPPAEDDLPMELQTNGTDFVGKSIETRDLMEAISTSGKPGKHVQNHFPVGFYCYYFIAFNAYLGIFNLSTSFQI
jgi:adenylate kinase